MKIIPLSEGAFTIDRTKKFIPFDTEKENLQDRSRGSLLVEIQPFVVITSRDIILLDTGLGFTNSDGHTQINANLSQHGIQSDDITKVLLSHLHKDHTGGIAQPNKKIVSFENAEYYVNQNEWEYALQDNPSYKPEQFKLLERYSRTQFIKGDGQIDDYIQYWVTGAHSPWHQAFKITEGDETVFFGGDVAPQLKQMKNKFRAKYDTDGQKAMELRQEWWQEGKQEDWTFLFYHDISDPVFTFNGNQTDQ